MSNIGKIIKQQRAIVGLTLRQLSEMSGVSSSYIGHIERDERFPSGSTLRSPWALMRVSYLSLLTICPLSLPLRLRAPALRNWTPMLPGC